jgi:hypothetical protein
MHLSLWLRSIYLSNYLFSYIAKGRVPSLYSRSPIPSPFLSYSLGKNSTTALEIPCGEGNSPCELTFGLLAYMGCALGLLGRLVAIRIRTEDCGYGELWYR